MLVFAVMKRRGIREDAGSVIERDIENLSNDINVTLSSVGSSLSHLESSVNVKKNKLEQMGIAPGQAIPSHLRTNPLSSTPIGASSKQNANTRRPGPAGSSANGEDDAPSEFFCDVMDSLQGLSHCTVVVTGLKTELKTVTDSLKGFGAIHLQSIQRTTDRRALFGQRPDRANLGKPLQLRPAARNGPSRLHSASTSHADDPPRDPEHKLSLLEHDAFSENLGTSNGQVAISFGSSTLPDDPSSAFSMMSKQDLMPLQGDDLALARQRDLQNIEGSVRELSSLFTKLSELVQSQGTEVSRMFCTTYLGMLCHDTTVKSFPFYDFNTTLLFISSVFPAY